MRVIDSLLTPPHQICSILRLHTKRNGRLTDWEPANEREGLASLL